MPGIILFPFASQLDLLLVVKFQNYYYFLSSSSRERSRGTTGMKVAVVPAVFLIIIP
jgi:hypothetical protein